MEPKYFLEDEYREEKDVPERLAKSMRQERMKLLIETSPHYSSVFSLVQLYLTYVKIKQISEALMHLYPSMLFSFDCKFSKIKDHIHYFSSRTKIHRASTSY